MTFCREEESAAAAAGGVAVTVVVLANEDIHCPDCFLLKSGQDKVDRELFSGKERSFATKPGSDVNGRPSDRSP